MGTTEQDALTVGCPKCKAAAGEGCVYVWTQERWIWNPEHRWDEKVVIHRTGAPTKRVHNERRAAYRAPFDRERRIARQAEERRRMEREKVQQIAKYRFQTGAARAYRQLVRSEHIALATWLAENP